MEGKGVEKDYTEALKWFNLAAKKRYVPAWVELGTMYEEGLGVKKDETEAVRWYKKAADKKDAEGQNKLGLMY
jgi:TPR repeat protein